jgi:hypothetical protein
MIHSSTNVKEPAAMSQKIRAAKLAGAGKNT